MGDNNSSNGINDGFDFKHLKETADRRLPNAAKRFKESVERIAPVILAKLDSPNDLDDGLDFEQLGKMMEKRGAEQFNRLNKKNSN